MAAIECSQIVQKRRQLPLDYCDLVRGEALYAGMEALVQELKRDLFSEVKRCRPYHSDVVQIPIQQRRLNPRWVEQLITAEDCPARSLLKWRDDLGLIFGANAYWVSNLDVKTILREQICFVNVVSLTDSHFLCIGVLVVLIHAQFFILASELEEGARQTLQVQIIVADGEAGGDLVWQKQAGLWIRRWLFELDIRRSR